MLEKPTLTLPSLRVLGLPLSGEGAGQATLPLPLPTLPHHPAGTLPHSAQQHKKFRHLITCISRRAFADE